MGRLDILRRGPSGGADPTRRCRAASSPAGPASAVAVVLVIAYLLAPRMGVDLSAQLARADFARHHPLTPVDFRWFGGTYPFGYSLWVPAVMAVAGAEIVGAVAAVASTYLLTRLLQNAGARRPLLGGIAAAVCQAANLVEGRVAFAVGTACGLGALLAVQKHRRVTAGVLAFLTGAANPVAALLLWLAAVVLAVRRRFLDAAILLAASAVPVALIAGLYSDGGHEPFGRSDAIHAVLASALVAVVIPRRYNAIRIGAVLGVFLVLAAYYIHTPVGSNATRLSLLFAIPLVVALVEFRPWLVTLTIIVAVVVQLPFTLGTLRAAGSPPTHASYYSPLLAEIASRGPITGRVEIPEMIGHWDTYYVAKTYPLARGWLRQVDTQLNGPTLYDAAPTATNYRTFVDDNAVEYVAVPDARLSAFGRREAAAIKGFSYLNPIWRGAHWTLYAVDRPTPVVAAPGTLTDYGAAAITFTAPAGSTLDINLRWFPQLSISGGGCIEPDGNQVRVHAKTGGSYIISSKLLPSNSHC